MVFRWGMNVHSQVSGPDCRRCPCRVILSGREEAILFPDIRVRADIIASFSQELSRNGSDVQLLPGGGDERGEQVACDGKFKPGQKLAGKFRPDPIVTEYLQFYCPAPPRL